MCSEVEALEQWGLGGAEVSPMRGGTANQSYRVSHATGRYVLRRRSPRYSNPDQIAFAHALMRRLVGHGGIGPDPIATPTGAHVVTVGEAVFELHPYVAGDAVNWKDEDHLRLAGSAIRRFHEATAGWAPPNDKAWPREDAPESIREGLDDLRSVITDPGKRAVLDTLETWADRIAQALSDGAFWGLPCQVIHGDFHPGNVNVTDEGMGLFDLDCAARQPRARDLADGILYFCSRRDGPFDASTITRLTRECWLEPARNRVFLDAYGSILPEEEEALPWLVAARWIYSRVRGRAKLPREAWPDYAVAGVLTPLNQLEEGRLF